MSNERDFLYSPDDFANAPPPNPRFVRALRGELMERATQVSGATTLNGHHGWIQAPAVAPHRRRRPAGHQWDRMLTYQAITVVVLLVALLGSIASGGGGRTGGGTGRPAVISATQEPNESVAMYREDAARTGISTQTGPISVPEIAWSQAMPEAFISTMIAADGVIYMIVNSDGGNSPLLVQARDATTGTQIWSTSVDEWYSDFSLIVAAGTVYVTSPTFEDESKGALTALSAGTGMKMWSIDIGGTRDTSPVVVDGTLYLLGGDEHLHAIDAASGKEKWNLDTRKMSEESGGTPLEREVSGLLSPFSPAVANGLVLITAGDGVLYAIDIATRSISWHFKSDGNSIETPAIVGGSVYVASCDIDNRTEPYDETVDHCWLYKLDAGSGIELARMGSPWAIDLVAATNEILVARVSGQTKLLSSDDLSIIAELAADEWGEATVTSDMIFNSDGAGTLFAYRYGGAESDPELLWSAYVGSSNTRSPLLVDGLLVTRGADSDGTLIALKASDATPTASSVPVDLSGLPACVPPPPVDWESLGGEPEFTISDRPGRERSAGEYGLSSGSQAWLDYDDLPSGAQASEDAKSGISATIQAINDCLKPGVKEDATGFFTEDFFRRNWVRSQIDEGAEVAAWFLGGLFPGLLQDFQTATLLPDGRVAILADPSDPQIVQDFAMYVIFVEVDGRWVVDESIRVGLGANQG